MPLQGIHITLYLLLSILVAPEAGLLKKSLCLAATFVIDKILRITDMNLGHTLLCILSLT